MFLFRDNLKEFVTVLRDIEMKLDVCLLDRLDMKVEFERVMGVF